MEEFERLVIEYAEARRISYPPCKYVECFACSGASAKLQSLLAHVAAKDKRISELSERLQDKEAQFAIFAAATARHIAELEAELRNAVARIRT